MTPEMHVWSPEQLRAFLGQVRHDPLYAAWLLFTTGMRRGEIAGLRWADVDLDTGRVSPRRPRVVVNYEVVISEPKTARGRRSLALDPTTVAALRDHRRRQLQGGWRSAPSRKSPAWCSPDRTAAPSTPSGSPAGSSSMPGRPASRRSGCTTCATAVQPRR
jgi:integrase